MHTLCQYNMSSHWVSVAYICLQFITTVLIVLLRNLFLAGLVFPAYLVQAVFCYTVDVMTRYNSGISAKILISTELELLRDNIHSLLLDNTARTADRSLLLEHTARTADRSLLLEDTVCADGRVPRVGDLVLVENVCTDGADEEFWDALSDNITCSPHSAGNIPALYSHVHRGLIDSKHDMHDGILNQFQSYQHDVKRSSTKVLFSYIFN